MATENLIPIADLFEAHLAVSDLDRAVIFYRDLLGFAGRGTEAAAEFQKILNHRGIVISDVIGALARLQMGRAIVLAGDKAKARSAYQDFLSLWKDGDSDIPILREAQAESVKLQQ